MSASAEPLEPHRKTAASTRPTVLEAGFEIIPSLLTKVDVDRGRSELRELLASRGPAVQLISDASALAARKIKDVALVSPFFMNIAKSDRVTELAASALGSESVRLFSSTAWMKPAFLGVAKPPHQDAAHWLHVVPNSFVTCWIAFDPSTPENGCVHFVSGSHRFGILEHRRQTDLLILDFDKTMGQPASLQPGDATLHLGRTVHWSDPNTSPHERRGVAFAYCRGDVVSRHVDLERLPLFARPKSTSQVHKDM